MSRVRVLLNSPINRARFPSPRTTRLLRLLVLAILRSPSPSVFSLSSPPPPPPYLSSFSSTVLSGSRPFIFYHCASRFSLARHRVPPSLRLQVARNSLQPPPPPSSAFLSLPERPLRPVERGAKISARLPDDSTASSSFVSLFLSFSRSFFFFRERIFFSRCRVAPLSLSCVRASSRLSLSSLFLLGRSVDIISATAFRRIDPSRIIGAGQEEETCTTTNSEDETRDAIWSGLCC